MAVVVSALSASCDEVPRPVKGELSVLVPVAESRAPYTGSSGIALANEDTACVIDTYQYKIYCANRGNGLWAFGRKGEGPGEFTRPHGIVRGPGSSVGIVDIGKERVLNFGTTGQLLSEVAVPPGFEPAGNLSSTLVGKWPKTEDYENMLFRFHDAEIDVNSGKVVWDRFFAADLVDCGPDRVYGSEEWGLGPGHPTPGGGIVFTACLGGFVVWFDNRDDSRPSAVYPNPAYTEQLRSSQEVDSYIEGAKRMRGGIGPSEEQIEEYRSRPKVWYRPRLRLDDRGRLWALSTRVENDSSYLDVHARTGYLGTVQVRHSAVGLDLLGSTLVVFVERPPTPDDPAGIPRRGIDWYDVSELSFDP